jgi:hypothetical protein
MLKDVFGYSPSSLISINYSKDVLFVSHLGFAREEQPNAMITTRSNELSPDASHPYRPPRQPFCVLALTFRNAFALNFAAKVHESSVSFFHFLRFSSTVYVTI